MVTKGHSHVLKFLLHLLLNGTTSERRCETDPPERTEAEIWPQTRTEAAVGRS